MTYSKESQYTTYVDRIEQSIAAMVARGNHFPH